MLTSRLYLMTLASSLAAGLIALVILGANETIEFISAFTIIYLIVTYAVKPRRKDRPDLIALALVICLALIVISAALQVV